MKRFFIVMLIGFLTTSLTAQTLTIKLNSTNTTNNNSYGNGTNRIRNYQVVLDGISYYSNSSTNVNTNTTDVNGNTNVANDIILTNQQLGSHTIAVYTMRNNNGNNNNGNNTNDNNTITNANEIYSNTFQLRQGYDMEITINPNGQVTFTEKRVRNNGNRNYNQQNVSAMSDASFNQLLQTVRSKWLQSSKIIAERDAFVNTSNYFTTDQVRQLLLLVSLEANRLALAKLAYPRVTDATAFTQLYGLFNSTASRNDLDNFIRNNPNTINANNNGNGNNNNNNGNWNNNNNSNQYKTPMADYQFSQLIQKINGEFDQHDKTHIERDAFYNTSYYFSTSQIRQLLSLINEENDRLVLAKLSYARVSDPALFTSLYNLFNSQASRDELNNFINGNSNSSSSRTAMADYQFSQLLQNANSQYSQSSRVETIRNAISNSNTYFSTYQIRQLLSIVNAEADRLSLAKLSYLRVSDPANFSSLYDLFYSQAYRNDLNNYVIQNGGTTTYNNTQYNTRIAMDESFFSQVLQKASNHFLPWDKVRDVREAFNNTSYYFTTSQIRQLLNLATSESDRLELAKLSWSRVIDPSYFTQLLDMFTNQSSRNDLSAYIQAHPF